ncbi:hypothetical protein KR067_001756 [Drosophila pandora]|nr:hypothetical protein KR067_001756 [Drosophila pandora]
MSEESISTPQSGRRPRLGLARRACHSTPLLRLQKEETDNKTPTGSLQNDTPKTFPLSMSARRVGLSKNRTELSKKKLEFAAVHDIKEQEGSISKGKEKTPPKLEAKKPERTKRKLREESKKTNNEEKESEQEVVPSKTAEDQPKSSKILELQGDIEIWRQGFIASLEDLQSMVDPKPSKSDLLVQLGIPLEMLRYLEDE